MCVYNNYYVYIVNIMQLFVVSVKICSTSCSNSKYNNNFVHSLPDTCDVMVQLR